MVPGATVICGARPEAHEPIFKFASGLCLTQNIDLILQPGIEAQIVKSAAFVPNELERFLLHDLVESRIRKSFARHPLWVCVIIAQVFVRSTNPCFDESRQLVRRERRQIGKWIGRSREFHLFCLTSDPAFVRVD